MSWAIPPDFLQISLYDADDLRCSLRLAPSRCRHFFPLPLKLHSMNTDCTIASRSRLSRVGKLLILATGLAGAISPGARGATLEVLSSGTTLDQGSSWNGGTAAGSGDIALWDSGSGTTTGALGTSVSWNGIQITTVSGINTLGATSGQILTFTGTQPTRGSIDLGSASADFIIASNISGSGAFTSNVTSGRTLTISGNWACLAKVDTNSGGFDGV